MALSPRARRILKRFAVGALLVVCTVLLALLIAAAVLRRRADSLEQEHLTRLTTQQAAIRSQPRPVLWGEPLDEDAVVRYRRLNVAFCDSESEVVFNGEPHREVAACERVAEAHAGDLAALKEAVRCRWCRWDLSARHSALPQIYGAELLFVHARARAEADPVGATESLVAAIRLGRDLERGGWSGCRIVERGLRELGENIVRFGERLPLDRVERALDLIEADLEPPMDSLERCRAQQGLALIRRMRGHGPTDESSWLADPHEHVCYSADLNLAYTLPEGLLLPHAVVRVDEAYAEAEAAVRNGDLTGWAAEEARLRGYMCQCLSLEEPHTAPSWNPWVVSHFPRAALCVDLYNLERARIGLARAAIKLARAHGEPDPAALPLDPCDSARRIVYEKTGARWALVSVGPHGHVHDAPREPVRLEGR